jgi:cytoskeleton-associated protein 5
MVDNQNTLHSVQPKPLLDNVRKALASTNVAVRGSAVSLLGTLYLYMGDALRRVMESEKPAIVQQINAEFDKVNNFPLLIEGSL